MEDGGCSLTIARVTNPNIIKVTTRLPYIYSPTKLEQLYQWLGAKNRGPIEEANQITVASYTSFAPRLDN